MTLIFQIKVIESMKIIFEQKEQIENFDQVVGFLMERLIYQIKDIFCWIKDILTSRQNIYCRCRCIGNANVMKGPSGHLVIVCPAICPSVSPFVCMSICLSVGNSVPLTNF